MKKLFSNRNAELDSEVGLYLECLYNCSLLLYEGVKDYFNSDEKFDERVISVSEYENQADNHLKSLKYILYKYDLVPDLSAGILELMDALDDIGDVSKQTLLNLQIERPQINNEIKDEFITIAKTSLITVEALIDGVRAYLTQVKTVEGYISKVYFYEAEVDKLEIELKKKIFSNYNYNLSEKMHLDNFVELISNPSDISEAIAIKLSVIKFKRGM